MKFIIAMVVSFILLASIATAEGVTLIEDIDGNSYYTGTFYKDANSNEVFKEVSVTTVETEDEIIETIQLGYIEEGTMETLKDME